MHVAVIGAGIIGVTTAFELAVDGHRVTVFEQRASVAEESSFAHAGVVSAGSVTPWGSPGSPTMILRQLLDRQALARWRAGLDPGSIAWAWQWWRASRSRTQGAQRLRLQRLAGYSRGRLHELTRRLQLDYERTDGCLVLLRTARELEAAQPGLNFLVERQTPHAVLDAAGCRAVEPGLSLDTPLHAGIHLPDDEVGNCRQFASLLRAEAERLGVRFRFHTTVQKIVAGADPQVVTVHEPPADIAARSGAETTSSDFQDTVPIGEGPRARPFDAVVLCAALGSTALLRPHGIDLPLQAVHGHSITAPLRQHELHPDLGPRSALIDERHKVVVSRIGSRVRVAGGAEIGGDVARLNPAIIERLYKVLHDWFPGTAQLDHVQRWKGARPMLSDGPPVIGASGVAGLWLNLGHGSNGWALACGSARLLADQVAGRTPALDVEGLGIERLQRHGGAAPR